jgi:hypothetical protein
MVVGNMYIEVVGKTRVMNETTGDYCDLEYKERGWQGKPND